MSTPTEHTWFQQQIAAYLAGGLHAEDLPRFQQHESACPACAASLAELRKMDDDLSAVFQPVRPTEDFEDRLIARLHGRAMPWRGHPMLWKITSGIAAAIVLGATGYASMDWLNPHYQPAVFTAVNMLQKGQAILQDASAVRLDSQHGKDGQNEIFDRNGLEWDGRSDITKDVFVPPVSNATSGSSTTILGLDRKKWSEDQKNLSYSYQNPYPDTKSAGSGSKLVEGLEPTFAIASDINPNSPTLSMTQAPKADYFTLNGNADKSGAGTLTISGNNTYTGGTNLSSGTLIMNGGIATYADAFKTTDGTLQLGDKTDLRSAIATAKMEKSVPQQVADANNRLGTAAPVPVPPPVENPAAQRKIIRHGEVTFEVDNFDSAVMQITKIVSEENGFVATTSSDKLANGKVTGTITVRVPPDNLDVLVLKLRGLGDLKGQKIGADDVTKDYTDLESELRAAKAMEDRLLDIIKTGKGEVKDLVEAEKELGVWREKVEHVTGEINYYNNLISLSTLNITLNEKDIRQAALATETETVNAGIEAEDVGKARQDLLKAIDDAKGRIIQSDLKAFDAGQLAAVVVADVPGEAAGPVLDRLKQLGRVARLDVGRVQTTASGQPPIVGAHVERQPTRFTVNIYNLANVAPRQTTNFGLAADDVEKTYHDIVQRITKAGGRVVTSSLNRAKADQVSAAINFESPDTAAAALLADVRTLGEVLNLAVTENPDAANTTSAKHGFTLSLVSLSALGARESIDRALAVADVSKAYNDILAAAGQAKARITQQQLDESHRQAVVGRLSLVVGRDQLETVEKAITDNHAGIVSRTQSRVTDDNNTSDSKVELRLFICNVDQLPPRQTTTVNIESTDPEKAGGDLQAAAMAANGRVVEQSLSTDGASRMHVVIDVPLKKSGEMLDHVRTMGTVKRIDQARDTSVPDADFVHARLDVTFATINPIVADDTGLASTLRSGLSTSIRGLLFSLEFIIIGLCLVLPWALVAWVGWKIFRRGKGATVKIV